MPYIVKLFPPLHLRPQRAVAFLGRHDESTRLIDAAVRHECIEAAESAARKSIYVKSGDQWQVVEVRRNWILPGWVEA